jgi:small GTP-binding protein
MSSVSEVRVVLIGDAAVGKTSLLNRFIHGHFDENELGTVGANFQMLVRGVNGSSANIQIWDTAGQEKYRALSPIYYREATGAIFVYDVTDSASYEHLNNWVSSFTAIAGSEAVIAIAANKIDLIPDYQGSILEAAKIANDSNYLFEPTSAYSNVGVAKLFEAFLTSVVELSARRKRAQEIVQLGDSNHTGCGC